MNIFFLRIIISDNIKLVSVINLTIVSHAENPFEHAIHFHVNTTI